jgi:UDP-N-acetylmuramate dehydrogenase
MKLALQEIELRGELLFNEPLAKHTSWRVGGPARCFFRPADREDLVLFLQDLSPDEPLLWIGLGSNLLVRDAGFDGTVIAPTGRLNRIELIQGNRLYVEAGVTCAKVARFAARAGLCGVEFLAGIPGAVGGALAMNAGAFGGETWQQVVKVETVDRYGKVQKRDPSEFQVGYRQVIGAKDEWFLSAVLQLQEGDIEESQERIRGLLEKRAVTQPTRLPSCGSVFRNPPGDHAGRLIEAAGLKGKRIGGAQVSDKHANFIVNIGDATAADIEHLIEWVQTEVESSTGIRLIPEVHRVGNPA